MGINWHLYLAQLENKILRLISTFFSPFHFLNVEIPLFWRCQIRKKMKNQ